MIDFPTLFGTLAVLGVIYLIKRARASVRHERNKRQSIEARRRQRILFQRQEREALYRGLQEMKRK